MITVIITKCLSLFYFERYTMQKYETACYYLNFAVYELQHDLVYLTTFNDVLNMRIMRRALCRD